MKLKNGGVKMDNIKRKLDEALRRAEDRAFANVIGPVIVVGGTLEKGPVCVMFKGPAGSGKTSIIREWARELSEEINFVELDVPKLSVQYVEDMPVVFSTDEIERMDRPDTVLFLDSYQHMKPEVEKELNWLYDEKKVADITLPEGERVLDGLILVVGAITT